jgi:hypothetical protein
MVTPLAHALWVGGSLFLVLLGVLVFATRPGAGLNRVLGALLVLRGLSDLFYEFMRDAASPADALFFHRMANWYDWPTLFLTLLFLHLVAPPRRFPRARVAVLALAAALTVLLVAAFVLAPGLFAEGAVTIGDSFRIVTPVLPQAYTVVVAMAQLAAVVLAVRFVEASDQTLLQRRRAALTGLSFGLLLGQAGLAQAALAVLPLSVPSLVGPQDAVGLAVWYGRGLVYGLGFVAVLVALPRLAAPFEGSGRALFLVAGAAALAVGTAQAADSVLLTITGMRLLPSHETSLVRVPFVVLSAACLALMLVRFDMAGFGAPAQRRVAAVSQVAIVATVALLPVGVYLALTGTDALLLGGVLLLALGAVTFSPAPLRAASEALSRLLLVSPTEHAAVGERARIYTQMLRERAGDAGGVPPASDPRLRALRVELGLAEGDHQLLAQVVRTGSGAELLLGRYRVDRELGRGAFGTALLATDQATGQKVVLKRFHARSLERRALAEASALAAVRHPRVVPLLAVERTGEDVFLVMAFAEGGTLQALLDRDGPLPPGRALALTLDMLDGLSALHAAGLAHGDVKPANVLLDRDGRALLADLGSAATLAEPDAGLTLTSSPVLGSYATVAPEILRGARRSPQADLYSTGAVLYRMLTGQDYVALDGKDAVGALEAILHAPPRLPHPRVPAALAPVLARALAKAPEDRCADTAAMVRDLVASFDLAQAKGLKPRRAKDQPEPSPS